MCGARTGGVTPLHIGGCMLSGFFRGLTFDPYIIYLLSRGEWDPNSGHDKGCLVHYQQNVIDLLDNTYIRRKQSRRSAGERISQNVKLLPVQHILCLRSFVRFREVRRGIVVIEIASPQQAPNHTRTVKALTLPRCVGRVNQDPLLGREAVQHSFIVVLGDEDHIPRTGVTLQTIS